MSSPQPAVGPLVVPVQVARVRSGAPRAPLPARRGRLRQPPPVGDADPWLAAVSAGAFVLGVWRVALALFEARPSPASSPGKALLGLAVVDLDGGRPAAGAAVVRLLLLDLLIAGPPAAAWWLAALRGVDEPLAVLDLQQCGAAVAGTRGGGPSRQRAFGEPAAARVGLQSASEP